MSGPAAAVNGSGRIGLVTMLVIAFWGWVRGIQEGRSPPGVPGGRITTCFRLRYLGVCIPQHRGVHILIHGIGVASVGGMHSGPWSRQ